MDVFTTLLRSESSRATVAIFYFSFLTIAFDNTQSMDKICFYLMKLNHLCLTTTWLNMTIDTDEDFPSFEFFPEGQSAK